MFSKRDLSNSSNLSPNSTSCFSVWNISESASLSFCIFSSFSASASAFASASFFILSTSSSDKLLPDSIFMECSLPVPLSTALTLIIPFASISKVTSICGIPLGDGGISLSWNLPRVLLSPAIGLSPCTTCISTVG